MIAQSQSLRRRLALRGASDAGRNRLRRVSMLAAACLAALVPLVLFGGFWVKAELGKSQRDVETYLSARALSLSNRVDAELEQQLTALRAISALPALDDRGEEFAPTTERIKSVMAHWSNFSLVAVENGRAGTSAPPGFPDARGLAPVADVAESRKARIETAAELGSEGSDVYLYVPVVRDGNCRFVLVATLAAIDIQSIANEQSREANLLSTVADEGNHILARSRNAETAVGRAAHPSFVDATAGRKLGAYQAVSREGDPVTSAFVRSPLTNWVSVVSMDQRQVDAMSTRPVYATVAAGGLSVLMAAILAVFVVTTVMERRVGDERLAASRALGDLDARLLATTQEALDEQRKSSSEREVLLREIYHRVKNNLQIVQSLLRLGSRELSPEQREPFESAVRRIGAMARVHTLLYNSPDLASIDFKDYLGELIRELSEGFAAEERSIASALAANPMRVPLDTAVPLAFIAVEILTNAYRHAFPRGRTGKISVEISRDDSFGRLVIEDDGVGVTIDPAKRRRLGLTIVRKLVQQIGGALEEPEPGSSRFVVRFPLDREASSSALPLPA